jgi:DNA-binding transcriptional LysR family regulator
MNFTQMNCFLKVADTHSFTKAAAELFLSQQAVSKYIGQLEEELEAPLLDRTTPYVTLTPQGESYYRAFTSAYSQLSFLNKDIADATERQKHRLRIGFSQWVNPGGELNDAIERFRKAHPTTRVTSVQYPNGELVQALMEGKVDAAFFSEAQYPQGRGLHVEPVAQGDLRIFAPADVMEDTSPEAVHRCWDLPLLMVPAWEWTYLERKRMGSREQEEFGLQPRSSHILPNLHSLLAAMRFGRCTTVGDARFGVFTPIEGVASLPLEMEDRLVCVWPGSQEHPLLPEFAETVKSALNG